MTCHDIRQQWHLYYDSEGDAELHWRLSRHLDECPDCAEWFSRQSRFEDLLSERLRTSSEQSDLWPRVLSASGVQRPKALRRWLLLATWVACAASLGLVVSAVWPPIAATRASAASLSQLSIDSHRRLATGALPIAYRSQSDLDVEAYLRREVNFPVRCPPRSDSGFAVEGAGTCQLAGEPVAFVVGEVETTPVSIFILSRESLRKFPTEAAALREQLGFQSPEGGLALAVFDQNLVLVVGSVPPDRLRRVLRAYGTYPHG